MTFPASRPLVAVILSLAVCAAVAAEAPPDFEQRLHDAVALQETGQHTEAVAIYRALLQQAPDNPRVRAGLAFSSYATGDWKSAIDHAERIVARGADCPAGVYLVLGSAYGMLGLWDKAEEALMLGQSVWPNDDGIRFQRAVNIYAQGRSQDAVAELERCIRRSPYRPEYWRALGDALDDQGARGRAFTAYARSATLEANPETSRRLAQRMWLMLSEGPRRSQASSSRAAIDSAESDGFSLIRVVRGDPEFRGKSDAAFFVYALDTTVRLVDGLQAGGPPDPFWRPFALAYFADMRKAGHMEALAMEIRTAAQDPDALRWQTKNADKLARFRASSERWAVNWTGVTVR